MVITIVALGIATIIPAVFLYFLYSRDFYGTGSFNTILLCFAWGMVAFGLAYAAAEILYRTGSYSVDEWTNIWLRSGAPIAEEIFKALILIFLVRRTKFTYFVDGAVYGFAAGIGFAVIENWSYVLSDESLAMGVAIGRVLSTNLVHATASAIVGIALGYSRFRKAHGKIALLLIGWVIAMALHIGFNNLVTADQVVNSSFLLAYAAIVGFSGAGFIVWMMNRGAGEQKEWIKNQLENPEGSLEGITGREAQVVNRLNDIEVLLAPIVEQFGEEKANQCERFLFLQARMAIKRQTLDKLTDENMKKGVAAEIEEMRTEMDEVRRSVGAYCMLYIRNIFPPTETSMWDRIQSNIDNRVKERPAGAAPAFNPFAKIEERAVQAGSDSES